MPDARTLEQILGELAGAASLCWIPRPTGEFDSAAASRFVAEAIAALRAAPAGVPREPTMLMQHAALTANRSRGPCYEGSLHMMPIAYEYDAATAIWQAMYDAAPRLQPPATKEGVDEKEGSKEETGAAKVPSVRDSEQALPVLLAEVVAGDLTELCAMLRLPCATSLYCVGQRKEAAAAIEKLSAQKHLWTDQMRTQVSLCDRLEAADEKIETLQREIAERDAEIARLKDLLETSRKVHDSQIAQLQAAEAEIDELAADALRERGIRVHAEVLIANQERQLAAEAKATQVGARTCSEARHLSEVKPDEHGNRSGDKGVDPKESPDRNQKPRSIAMDAGGAESGPCGASLEANNVTGRGGSVEYQPGRQPGDPLFDGAEESVAAAAIESLQRQIAEAETQARQCAELIEDHRERRVAAEARAAANAKDAFDAICNEAAGSLPDDWEINICLERGAGWVDLFRDGSKVDVADDDMSMTRKVRAAIDAALKATE